jgi:hypothetical protein
MPNSIRTPRQGVSARSRRIAQAVDNEGWQEVRLSMKGISTAEKLDVLEKYWKEEHHKHHDLFFGDLIKPIDIEDCDICIRVDNYLKALMRGGQLVPFIGLSYVKHVGGYGHKWRDTLTNGQDSIIRK